MKREHGAAPQQLEHRDEILGEHLPYPGTKARAVNLVDEVKLVAKPEELGK